MRITEEMVDYISLLSRLKPNGEERERLRSELEKIVSYMDVLNTLDTADIEPMSHVFPVKNVLREDVVEPSFPREELMKNAPGGDEEAYLVPKAVE